MLTLPRHERANEAAKTEFDSEWVWRNDHVGNSETEHDLTAGRTRRLRDIVLIKNARLSVQPVSEAEWQRITAMRGLARS
ncbi:MAG: EVE domain-containing protein [Bauldia sp.]|nr:EVE domain-containing protein [Bauldia sp.]